MKLHSVVLVIVFSIVELTGMVRSLCLVKNTRTPKVYWYQCFVSDEYLADVNKAPIDVPRLTFANSNIKVLRDKSFIRLAKYLERLALFHCNIEEIEDNAFQGLAKLEVLAVAGNKLQYIKSAWFKELSNLKMVSLQNNEIKHIEVNFFSILPPLETLDISANQITCLPTASFGNFKADEFHFRHNRLNGMCQADLMNWLKDANIRYDDLIDLDYMDTHYDVTKMCTTKLPKSQLTEKLLNECAEKTTREFLPAKGNYTVKQVCEFLKDTPSPFLECTNNR